MRKTVYYIANYADDGCFRNITTQPSSVSKVNYVKTAIKQAGFDVFVYSTAEGNQNCRYCTAQTKRIDENEKIFYPIVIGRSNYVLKLLSRGLLYIQLLFFIIYKLDANNIILVYHSLQICPIISFIRKVFNRKIYFEVEEIYSACYNKVTDIDKEIMYLQNAEGYILVNDIIKEKCNLRENNIVCYGSYNYNEPNIKNTDVQTINIIYAGLIDSCGSDVYLAVDIAKYLPNNYHVYILGYGSNKNISALKKYIQTNKNVNNCSVSYEGCFTGHVYIDFLAKCRIGLCPRVLEDSLSDYTFPSKVLMYMCNGITPVCTPISCVKNSAIKDYVVFSENSTAESLSKAILNVDLSFSEGYQKLIINLHRNFVKDLSNLL